MLKKLMGQPTFQQLVEEARQLQAALGSYTPTRPGDLLGEKLNAEAYLREGLKRAGISLKQAEQLDTRIAALPEDENEHIFAFLAQVRKQMLTVMAQEGCLLRPPTGNLHRFMSGHQGSEFALLVGETMAANTNPWELVALAALRATRECPECFGPLKDWDEAEKQRARLGEIHRLIGQRWREAELEHEIDDAGHALVSVKAGNITVPLVPVESLGERLIAAQLSKF